MKREVSPESCPVFEPCFIGDVIWVVIGVIILFHSLGLGGEGVFYHCIKLAHVEFDNQSSIRQSVEYESILLDKSICSFYNLFIIKLYR